MSMPSDVTSDISQEMGSRAPRPRSGASKSLLQQVTTEQLGVAAATFVAFLGVAVIGPRLAELRRPPTLKERARDSARTARRRAEAARAQAGQRLRDLGSDRLRR